MPILSTGEATALAGGTADTSKIVAPTPHPLLSRTPSSAATSWDAEMRTGAHTEEILSELGLEAEELAALRREGALGEATIGYKL